MKKLKLNMTSAIWSGLLILDTLYLSLLTPDVWITDHAILEDIR